MTFIDQRKPNMTHLYFVYVFEHYNDEGEYCPAMLYRTGSIMELKRLLRDQRRKFDIVRVW